MHISKILIAGTALAGAGLSQPAVAGKSGSSDMVAIPAGTFLMGSTKAETDAEQTLTHHTGLAVDDDFAPREKPQHEVHVPAFEIATTMVTRGQFARFVAATGYTAKGCYAYLGTKYGMREDADWQSIGFPQSDQHPVTCVNYDDASAYVSWLSQETGTQFRLPTEAEFEYATRAGTTTSRYWGDDITLQCAYANGADITVQQRDSDWITAQCHDDYYGPSPVATFAPNAWGLYDMIGNLYQLVEDCWHDTYEGAPSDGSAWTDGAINGSACELHPIRGGSHSPHPGSMRSASRVMTNDTRSAFVGFRVARSVD
ncbi:formylglycine-generating enzyme family protein [Novosphingobium sp. BW1]|uniref:formylglycine-generating enzyme family protein n=1 Tax=Novosphingobium sp. BW1 TaxID=2592621 RepID=UPI001396977A|nr:formylglycine-generating enzyme family protein [Novosphingobium sp. BW1]